MITENYVSFKLAKLLKEKGFDGSCYKVWESHGDSQTLVGAPSFVEGETVVNRESVDAAAKQYVYEYNLNNNVEGYLAPTLQMAMKWLREVHNYNISICLDSYVEPYDNQYYIVIRRRKDKYEDISPCEQVYFDSYEQACEAAIRYCLENLIN